MGRSYFYKGKKKQKLEKLNARWDYGIFVGVRRKSNEMLVVTEKGLEEVRSVRRLPEERRWGEDNLNWVKWAPWRRYKDAVEADGDLPEGVPAGEQRRNEDQPGRLVVVDTRERAPGELYTAKQDLTSMGTPGVVGDVLVFLGVWEDSLIQWNVGKGLEKP